MREMDFDGRILQPIRDVYYFPIRLRLAVMKYNSGGVGFEIAQSCQNFTLIEPCLVLHNNKGAHSTRVIEPGRYSCLIAHQLRVLRKLS